MNKIKINLCVLFGMLLIGAAEAAPLMAGAAKMDITRSRYEDFELTTPASDAFIVAHTTNIIENMDSKLC